MLDWQELLREQVICFGIVKVEPPFIFIEEKQKIWIQDSKRTFLIILLL